jgi:hypothetical protein
MTKQQAFLWLAQMGLQNRLIAKHPVMRHHVDISEFYAGYALRLSTKIPDDVEAQEACDDFLDFVDSQGIIGSQSLESDLYVLPWWMAE